MYVDALIPGHVEGIHIPIYPSIDRLEVYVLLLSPLLSILVK